MERTRPADVIVVGAGIAGLTAAHRMAGAGLRVRVLEAAPGPGGRMSTATVGGVPMELGAQFLSTGYEMIPQLLDATGLSDQIVEISGKALIVGEGRSWRFDTGRPLSLVSSRLLRMRDLVPAARGRWRVRRLVGRPTNDLGRWTDLDGRVGAEWARRHFGTGLTQRVVSPAVHGLYFQELVDNAAPLPAALGTFFDRGSATFTLRGGLGRLTTALAKSLDVEYDVRVDRVRRPGGARPSDARVTLSTSGGEREAAAVVLATPAAATARMLPDPTPDEAAVLRVPYASGLLVGLGMDEPLRAEELDGSYGALFAPEVASELAAIAVYSRADANAATGEAVTLMFRQDAARRMLGADDTAVRSAGLGAAAAILPGLSERVVDSRVVRWGEALPYVNVGHARAVRRYRERLPSAGTVLLAGDFLGFPWSDSAAFNGSWAADRLTAAFATRTG